MTQVEEKQDIRKLREMIERHVKETGSRKGQGILNSFEEQLPLFKKILPVDYREMTSAIFALEEKGMSRDDAELEAFNQMQKEGA